MEPNWGFTAVGFVRPTMQEIKDYLIESYLEEMPGADFSTGSILDIQISAEAEVKAKQYADLERALEETYLDTSNGLFVDRNVRPLGKKRKQATYAVSRVKFQGTEGKHIPRGLAVLTVSGLVFRTVEEGKIVASDGVVLKVSSEHPGSQYNVSKGAIQTLMNPDMDIVSVTNIEAAFGGSDLEKDYELKERVYGGFIQAENKPVDIINFEIASLDGVKSSVVLENKTEVYQDVVGPHSLLAVVDGGKDEDIFKVLFDFLPFGVQTKTNALESVTRKVVSDGPNIYELCFLRPEEVNFKVKVEVVTSRALTEGEKQVIKLMIEGVYKDMKVGQNAIPKEIFIKLGDIIHYNSLKVFMSKTDREAWVDFIELKPTQIGKLQEVIIVG